MPFNEARKKDTGSKRAVVGEMLNIHDLKAAYERAIGHATSDSTVYNLLHRHGWRKLMPRPFHPMAGNRRTRRPAGLWSTHHADLSANGASADTTDARSEGGGYSDRTAHGL
jgi:hypothetical protein